MSCIRGAFRLFLMFLASVILVPFQLVILLFTKGKAAFIITKLWHKIICAIFAIKVSVEGTPTKSDHVVFIGNHLSYLDIPVIGSFLPVRFIAKQDVSGWPVFGFLSKLQQTYFINRSRLAARTEKERLTKTLNDGGRFLIFPEGTSSDGTIVLPFKSAAFSMFFNESLHELPLVQPFSIHIVAINGTAPDTQDKRDIYAWHGDISLAPHLWGLAKSKHAHIQVTFHDPIEITKDMDRKSLSDMCFQAVSKPCK